MERLKTNNEIETSTNSSELQEQIKRQQNLIDHLHKIHEDQKHQIESLTIKADLILNKEKPLSSSQTQNNIEHVTPSVVELLNNAPAPYRCQQPNCTQTFQNSGHVFLHLLKHHKIPRPPQTTRQYFHCPVAACKYHHHHHFFLNRKSLRQHYVKVHATKSSICLRCSMAFANDRLLANHERRQCGQLFECNDCPCKYGSREALQTHCRRKKHKMMVAEKSLRPPVPPPPPLKTLVAKKLIKICPKPSSPHNEMNKSSQTTCTQTLLDSSSSGPKGFLDKWHKRTVATTATATTPDIMTAAATSTRHDHFKDLDFYDSESNHLNLMASSSSQTDRNLNNMTCMDGGVYTDSINYFADGDNFPGLCDIETQTEMFFSAENEQAPSLRMLRSTGCGTDKMEPIDESSVGEQLDQLLYNNMQTQTCDDILSADFGWTDIQTQTNWTTESIIAGVVSTETQTSFSTFLLQQNASTYTQTTTCGWPDESDDELEF